ncbi:DUF4124 domain-containing protein [Inmirania thermothiophila]|uniref:Uncharacterized protein DUF4124 n=1 Tax=Inmirania thermothiophila TaxID=1750597 RepID=A0A3N1Y8F1_9GAMM|nr:DUF4124 domain-containing protein [Inmirania thermothiophila]ROR35086.1 uncharacterized protein DUF4124 [Inmirania thermothiophila]
MRPLLVLAAVLALPPAMAATVYRWTDDEGVVHYGAAPPPGREATPLQLGRGPAPPPRPPAAPPAPQRQAAPAPAAPQARVPPEVAAENCRRARANLGQLTITAVRRYRLPDGRVVTLTAEERQRRIEAARAQIRRFCTDS